MDIVNGLLGRETSIPRADSILWLVRLPKSLTALLAGAALSVCGGMLQALFRNPLADPFVLGINSGGSLGAAAAILFGGVLFSSPYSLLNLVFFAWLGALGSSLLVLLAARRVEDSGSLLIVGLMIGYIVNAFVGIMIHFSGAAQVKGFVAWGFGSFGMVPWERLFFMIPALLSGLFLSFFLCKPLNALLLGEQAAAALGVSVRRARFATLSVSALLAGTVTAFCGPIGFIGLAVPHIARRVCKSGDHRRLIPLFLLLGGTLALLADMLTQIPADGSVLPLNAVTSLIGAPFVLHVLLAWGKR
jgi:iron complex transport system permease protein